MSTTTTRRGLFTGAAALSALGAVPVLASVAADADAELIRLCEQFHRQHAEFYSISDDDWEALGSVADGRRSATSDAIEGITPITAEGFRMKAAVGLVLLVEHNGIDGGDGGDGNCDVVFALAVLRDLVGHLPIVKRSLRLIELAERGEA